MVLRACSPPAVSSWISLVERTAHHGCVEAVLRGADGSAVYRLVLFQAQLQKVHVRQLDELALEAVNSGSRRVVAGNDAAHSLTIY